MAKISALLNKPDEEDQNSSYLTRLEASMASVPRTLAPLAPVPCSNVPGLAGPSASTAHLAPLISARASPNVLPAHVNQLPFPSIGEAFGAIATLPPAHPTPVQAAAQCAKPEHKNPLVICTCEVEMRRIADSIKDWVLATRPPGHPLVAADFTVFKMGSGGYNVVFAINCRDGAPPNNLEEVVFRLPRRRGGKSSEMTVLKEIQERAHGWGLQYLKAPGVVRDSLDSDAEISWPFVMIERMTGIDLNYTWCSFSDAQKADIAWDMGRIYHEIITKTDNPQAGVLTANEHSLDTVLIPLGSAGWYSENGLQAVLSHPQYVPTFDWLVQNSWPPQSPYMTMKVGLEWRKLQHHCGSADLRYTLSTYETCLAILEDLRSIGLFDLVRNDFVLYHWDLFPRNILGDVDVTTGRARVSGIIDWEGAIYAPDFVACRPPKWMWRDCYLRDDRSSCTDCHRCPETEEEEFVDLAHDNPGAQIKRAFLRSLEQQGDSRRIQIMMFDHLFVMARIIFDIIHGLRVARCVSAKPDQGQVADELKSIWTILINTGLIQEQWAFTVSPTHIHRFNGSHMESHLRMTNWE